MKLYYQGCYEVRRGEMDELYLRVDSVAECNQTCYIHGFQYFTLHANLQQVILLIFQYCSPTTNQCYSYQHSTGIKFFQTMYNVGSMA